MVQVGAALAPPWACDRGGVAPALEFIADIPQSTLSEATADGGRAEGPREGEPRSICRRVGWGVGEVGCEGPASDPD